MPFTLFCSRQRKKNLQTGIIWKLGSLCYLFLKISSFSYRIICDVQLWVLFSYTTVRKIRKQYCDLLKNHLWTSYNWKFDMIMTIKKGVENLYLSSGSNKSISNFRETIPLNCQSACNTVQQQETFLWQFILHLFSI
jgi:hypothetical protein